MEAEGRGIEGGIGEELGRNRPDALQRIRSDCGGRALHDAEIIAEVDRDGGEVRFNLSDERIGSRGECGGGEGGGSIDGRLIKRRARRKGRGMKGGDSVRGVASELRKPSALGSVIG